jgi:hypothetical protein
VRNLAPWALLLLLGLGGAAGAAVGIAGSHAGSATGTGGADAASGARQSEFVGLTLQQARQLAHAQGVDVRIWRVPAGTPAGTVMEEVSSHPAFLIVSSGPPANRHAVLPGAMGPPVHAVCAPGFRLAADGNAGPATCPGGEVNAATWEFFAASHPPMLSLGRDASRCDVARAYDDEQLTAAMNFTVFQLANAYYGWDFGSGFTDELVGSGGVVAGCGSG